MPKFVLFRGKKKHKSAQNCPQSTGSTTAAEVTLLLRLKNEVYPLKVVALLSLGGFAEKKVKTGTTNSCCKDLLW